MRVGRTFSMGSGACGNRRPSETRHSVNVLATTWFPPDGRKSVDSYDSRVAASKSDAAVGLSNGLGAGICVVYASLKYKGTPSSWNSPAVMDVCTVPASALLIEKPLGPFEGTYNSYMPLHSPPWLSRSMVDCHRSLDTTRSSRNASNIAFSSSLMPGRKGGISSYCMFIPT